MNVARHMVQGVDVWLNNPRRPLEASGTSGMKVCCNGGLNLSILDGWWDEGYTGDNGWAIGSGEEYKDTAYQDEVEGRAIYELIERDIVPLFYNRGPDGLPRQWIKRMKRSMATNTAVFNTNRMVEEYTNVCYLPAYRRYGKLQTSDYAGAKTLSAWRAKTQSSWGQIRFENVNVPTGEHLHVGQSLEVNVKLFLGPLQPADVEVQLYHGTIDATGQIPVPVTSQLAPDNGSDGHWNFTGKVTCTASGQYGYCVRVLPKHELLPNPFEPNLITWA
jgi:glycogen phosphorylase